MDSSIDLNKALKGVGKNKRKKLMRDNDALTEFLLEWKNKGVSGEKPETRNIPEVQVSPDPKILQRQQSTFFNAALYKGDTGVVHRLIETGQTGEELSTIAYKLAGSGDIESLTRLNTKSSLKDTVPQPTLGNMIILGVRNRDMDLLKFLSKDLDLGREYAIFSNNRALRESVKSNNVKALLYLKSGFGLTTDDARASKNDALITALTRGYHEIVRVLHREYRLDNEDVRDQQDFVLYHLCSKGKMVSLKYIFDDFKVMYERKILQKAYIVALKFKQVKVTSYLKPYLESS